MAPKSEETPKKDEDKKSAPKPKPTGKENWGEGGSYRIDSDGKRIRVKS